MGERTVTDGYERRFAEFRVDDSGTITGAAMVYGDRAKFGDFEEVFAAGSLKGSDVIVNLQHDRGKPVAREGAGLTLVNGSDALRCKIVPPNTVYGREAKELVEARILRGFSVEFRAIREEWTKNTRSILEAELSGIGLVDRPAYSESYIALRFAERRVHRPRRYFL